MCGIPHGQHFLAEQPHFVQEIESHVEPLSVKVPEELQKELFRSAYSECRNQYCEIDSLHDPPLKPRRSSSFCPVRGGHQALKETGEGINMIMQGQMLDNVPFSSLPHSE